MNYINHTLSIIKKYCQITYKTQRSKPYCLLTTLNTAGKTNRPFQ